MDKKTKVAVQRLVKHVCGKPEFDEQAAFDGLEKVIDYDWQKKFVQLLGELDDQCSEESAGTGS